MDDIEDAVDDVERKVDEATDDVGTAKIVYDHPEDGTTELKVENDDIVYFDDHWLVKVGEDESGDDLVRRIPRNRVHFVERSIEELEQKVQSVVEKTKEQFGWWG
ncbi:hypothetical protein DMJ13_14185 [halophilic archaeon]|nr:hypothetical protein DMJ13_14185 [halophilic archaeon]